MFGVVPRTIWSGWTEPDEYNRIRLDCNCVLLEDGEHVVLVEAGYGSKWTAKERGLYAMEERSVVDALAEIEVDPSTITHVILSHLHFDHAGALTTWRDLVFPGDLCPTRLHAHPSTSMAYDMEPWTSLRGKQALLRRCADEGRLIVLDHDPDEPLARALESPERPGRHVLEPVHGL